MISYPACAWRHTVTEYRYICATIILYFIKYIRIYDSENSSRVINASIRRYKGLYIPWQFLLPSVHFSFLLLYILTFLVEKSKTIVEKWLGKRTLCFTLFQKSAVIMNQENQFFLMVSVVFFLSDFPHFIFSYLSD
jgi:hypothetical protein